MSDFLPQLSYFKVHKEALCYASQDQPTHIYSLNENNPILDKNGQSIEICVLYES